MWFMLVYVVFVVFIVYVSLCSLCNLVQIALGLKLDHLRLSLERFIGFVWSFALNEMLWIENIGIFFLLISSLIYIYIYSNIPSKIFYSAFGGDILRFARNTSDPNLFKDNAKCLIHRVLKQCGENDILTNILKKLFGRYFDTFSKYCNNYLDFVNMIEE